MYVFEEAPREFDEKELYLTLGLKPGKEPNPRVRDAVPHVMEEAFSLVEPKGMYDIIPVRTTTENRIYLDEDTYFESDLLIKFMGGAKQMAVGIYTIGKALEERSDEYMNTGRALDATLMDAIGTVLAENGERSMARAIRNYAGELGLEASVRMNPGQTDLSIESQQTVFNLLNAKEIGVTLTPSLLMIPRKSVSALIGLGHDVVKEGEDKACMHCPLQPKCTAWQVSEYRREREANCER